MVSNHLKLIFQVSPLHYAARHNHLDVIKVLVEFGADVNIRGDDGLRPLHYAARFKISQQSSRKESRGFLVSTYLPDMHSQYGNHCQGLVTLISYPSTYMDKIVWFSLV